MKEANQNIKENKSSNSEEDEKAQEKSELKKEKISLPSKVNIIFIKIFFRI